VLGLFQVGTDNEMGLLRHKMKRVFIIAVIAGLVAGLITQFVWKMVYFPEPLILVVGEVAGIIVLAGLAIWYVIRL